MKIRTYAVVVVCLSTLVCLPAWLPTASLVSAQDFFAPPPLPPGPVAPPIAWGSQVRFEGEPSLWYGMFYITAGAKWRRVTAVFEPSLPGYPELFVSRTEPDGTALTFPFGPATEGPFATFAPDDTWVYSNGTINSKEPTGAGLNRAWPGVPALVNNALGHDKNPQPPPDVRNTGSFIIKNPVTQTSNAGGTVSETRSVTFNLAATTPGSLTSTSRVVSATPRPWVETTVDLDVWAPYFEAGFHQSSYFDLFLGFTGFDISKVYNATVLYDVIRTTTTTGQIITGAKDTFPFSSDASAAWTSFGGSFDSALSTTTDLKQYYIYPVGNGIVSPTRTFITTSVSDEQVVQVGTLTDRLYSRIDASMYELKTGGRSWFQLYGMGRTTSSLGPLFAWIPYRIVTARCLTNPEDIDAGEKTISANSIDIRTWDEKSGTWFNFGVFVSLGLEVGLRRWFVTSSVEYDWYFLSMHHDEVVQTAFRPSGISGDIGIGFRF